MTLLFHALLGFIAPHIGGIFDTIKSIYLAKTDRERAEQIAKNDLERIIQTPVQPAGARFISAIQESKFPVPVFIVGLVLLFYVFLDWVTDTVRPGITWILIATWITYGLADGWTSNDHNILIMVLAYWFSDITLARKKK